MDCTETVHKKMSQGLPIKVGSKGYHAATCVRKILRDAKLKQIIDSSKTSNPKAEGIKETYGLSNDMAAAMSSFIRNDLSTSISPTTLRQPVSETSEILRLLRRGGNCPGEISAKARRMQPYFMRLSDGDKNLVKIYKFARSHPKMSVLEMSRKLKRSKFVVWIISDIARLDDDVIGKKLVRLKFTKTQAVEPATSEPRASVIPTKIHGCMFVNNGYIEIPKGVTEDAAKSMVSETAHMLAGKKVQILLTEHGIMVNTISE